MDNNSVLIALSEKQDVRVYVADTTDMVEEARKIHDLSPVSTAAFGRVLTATAIMGRMEKIDNEKITLQVKGSNKIKHIIGIADTKGNVKGYISNTQVDNLLNPQGKLDVGGAVGVPGEMIVIKDFGLKEPFIGRSELISGEIAEDLTNYFATSEQQPTAVSLGVFVGKDNTVVKAGGFLVQLMPFASDETITQLEENIKGIDPVTKMMQEDMSIEQIAEKVLEGLGCSMTLEYVTRLQCDCSKEKMSEGLKSIGKEELQTILDEDGQAELQCHFCKTKYDFSKDELEGLIKEL